MSHVADFGSWRSPITADLLVQHNVGFKEVLLDGNDIYLLESRPTERGRHTLLRYRSQEGFQEILPTLYNARSLMFSYGGGSFLIHQGVIFFSHFATPVSGEMPYAQYQDQRLYSMFPGEPPRVLTATLNSCYADTVFDQTRNRLIAVREDRTLQYHGDAFCALVAIDITTGKQTLLTFGNDFYSNPRLSPDGSQLCWLTWNYPQMPWDGNQLWLADINAQGTLSNLRSIAGGTEESILQPEWSPDGSLYFQSDRTNWWNFYRFHQGQIEPIYLKNCDFGVPRWVMRISNYAFISAERLVCSFTEEGQWNLGVLHLPTKTMERVWSGYSEIYQVRANEEFAVFCAGDPQTPLSLYQLPWCTGTPSLLKSSSNMPLETLRSFISLPTSITFPTGNNEVAYGFYYPPTNPDFKGPSKEKPPLILQCHGGPTGATTTTLDWEIQYFTSRGFGVIDINYRGSSGYGRQFRLSLYKNWGVYDPEDCLKAAEFLIQKGSVHPKKIVARGGSAGGYTTLCLLTSSTLCAAGASYFGISNMEMIAQHSDKLELHYPDRLVGIYPDEIELYRERSPVYHADRVQSPLIFFQGMEDPVVPPEQTQVMVDSLDKRKVPHVAFYFPNEQHGFRSAENIKKALEAEYYFYAQILGFTLADPLPPIEIKHWKKTQKTQKKMPKLSSRKK